MDLWWLCGGCVFPVVVKPEIWTYKIKFDLERMMSCGADKLKVV